MEVLLKKRLHGLLLATALLLALLPAAGAAAEADSQPVLGIYTTGDMAGRIFAKDPVTGEEYSSSYLKVAAAMAQQRQQEEATLLLDSGNAVHNGLVSLSGQAEAAALRAIGYDALVPGVEELRLGSQARQAFFQALESEEDEQSVSVLSGNLLGSQTGLPVTQGYEIYTVELDGSQLKVAVVGLGAIQADTLLPEQLLSGLDLAHPENTQQSYAWEWSQYWQPRLEQEKCDLTVVVCHDTAEALTELAGQTTGIDLLVGGCGAALTDTLTNAEGEEVALVSGGGSALTHTVVTLDEDGAPVVGESELLSLSQYENNMELARQMTPYRVQYEEQAEYYVGRLAGQWGGESSYSVQSTATDLVGEAMLWATQADAALIRPSDLGLDMLSQRFQRGTVSTSITKADCIALAPDPEPVVMVELTGAQLRQWLEGAARYYQVSETTGAVYGGEGADVLYGMDYELYLGNDAGQRVTGLTCQGQPVQDSQVFRIAVSARRLDEEEFPVRTAVWSAAAQGELAAQRGTAASTVAAYAADATTHHGSLTPERSSTWVIYTGAYGQELTRLEFITMLYQYAGSPEPGADAAFIDVMGNDAVVWAAETGIVSGNGKGYFYPNQTLTREQAAVMLYNYARSQGVENTGGMTSLSGFLDAGEIAGWAVPAVTFCTQAGVIQGGGTRGDLFQPQSGLTRQEADRALERFFSYLGE